MNSRRSTAEVVAHYIDEMGVQFIFGYPGDPTIDFMEASRQRGLDVVLARREGTAAFMAEAYAMATGRPGVCLSTLGPGSSALVNGVAAATLDRVPMVAISGQIESSREQFFTHQVLDHKMLFTPVAKWAGRVEASAAATTMRKALRLATAERPGAVHLTCTGNTFQEEATDQEVRVPPLSSGVSVVQVHRAPGNTIDPRNLLARSRRPVLLAGIAATRTRATPALIRLSEAIGMPVVVSPMAKGVFPEEHSLFAGVLDMACNHLLWRLLDESDLVVTAGFDPVELIKPWSISTPVLHVDTMPNVDQIYPSDCELVGDVGAALDWLGEGWNGEPRWTEREVGEHRRTLHDGYYEGRVEGKLNPTDVVDGVRAATPRETVVTCDVGSHKLLVGQGWQAYEPRTVLMTNGLSSMGFGVPSALAAGLAHGDRPVVALVGDGGFAMAATEMRLAANRRLPLAVVVLVDGSLNRIELKQMKKGYPSTATRIEETDLVGLAEAMGCDGVRVASVTELDKALTNVGSLSRPLVVEARVDPSQYESQF